MTFGFQWHCPWRITWKVRREYWDRYQFGPFYILKGRRSMHGDEE